LTSPQFENLVNIGQLKTEPGDQTEFDGLVNSGRLRLKDARLNTLSLESRFDLAYNAAHALALAALRWQGYRSDNRYIFFNVCHIPWGETPKCGVSLLTAIISGIVANMKGCWTSINS